MRTDRHRHGGVIVSDRTMKHGEKTGATAGGMAAAAQVDAVIQQGNERCA
jgi:hypothetical protein